MTSGKTIGLLIGLLVLGLGVAVLVGGEDLIARFFGPPQVELAETYADAEGEATFDHWDFDELLGPGVGEPPDP